VDPTIVAAQNALNRNFEFMFNYERLSFVYLKRF